MMSLFRSFTLVPLSSAYRALPGWGTLGEVSGDTQTWDKVGLGATTDGVYGTPQDAVLRTTRGVVKSSNG